MENPMTIKAFGGVSGQITLSSIDPATGKMQIVQNGPELNLRIFGWVGKWDEAKGIASERGMVLEGNTICSGQNTVVGHSTSIFAQLFPQLVLNPAIVKDVETASVDIGEKLSVENVAPVIMAILANHNVIPSISGQTVQAAISAVKAVIAKL